jgi:hypothetical protein
MSGSGIDEDTAIAIAAGVAAVAFFTLAVRGFSGRRFAAGVVFLALAAASGLAAWFFAAFTMRMM